MAVPDDEKQKNVEETKNGGLLSNRSCTDCLMIPVAILFMIGWIVIIAVAISQGKPRRMLYPENFRGDLCGDMDPLTDYPNLWIPRPSRTSYGLCVQRCPEVGDFVCNNDEMPEYGNPSRMVPNHVYNHNASEAIYGKAIATKCALFSCSAEEQAVANKYIGMQIRLTTYNCFINFYASAVTLYRCIPFQDQRDNETLAAQLGETTNSLDSIAVQTGAKAFFNRGFGEVEQSWLVILICCLTCCVISFIWLILLRWIMKPIVYLCILLILGLLIVVGYLAMRMGDDLEDVRLPGDTATENQVKLWRALQYGAWILAAMYIILMMWLIKRIKIAIAVMREASYSFTASPGLSLIPPIVFVLFLAWVAFFIVTTIYIQTIGTLEDGTFEAGARSAFGDTAVNLTFLAANATAEELASANLTLNRTVNTSTFTQDEKIKALHAYNFFGFLWASSFCIMFGFFVTAMTGAAYYFSATQQQMYLASEGKSEEEGAKEKGTEYFTIPRSVWCALRYHLGTILFGSLLIAIVQFVRALFLYFKEQFLEDWKESATVRIAIACIEYCLWYIQKIVEIISKNAFIVCCVLKTNFCSSAGTAVSLLVSNAARVGTLTMLATVACWVLKIFIVGCNMIIAYFLIRVEDLTQDRKVESGLFPLFGILILSFIIASIFVNVYESLVDTTLMSFLLDEEYFGGEFMVPELAELTDMFKGAEEARREYEKRLREATHKKPGKGEAKKEEKDGKGDKADV